MARGHNPASEFLFSRPAGVVPLDRLACEVYRFPALLNTAENRIRI